MRVLMEIKDTALDALDLLDVLNGINDYRWPRGYNFYRGDKRAAERSKRQKEREMERTARHRYYSLLSSLKRDGLIKEATVNNKQILKLTVQGKDKLGKLKDQAEKFPDLPSNEFPAKPSNTFVVVTFDIPEKMRRERSWLREALKNVGLEMIQKSVWIGKVKIPKELLDDLYTLRLTKFVEIFEINKRGSLEHIL